jgi:long-chain fatty acid transport protein
MARLFTTKEDKMRKVLTGMVVLAFLLSTASLVMAGGAINKSNRSTEYMRILARNAATDSADIVTYNPAGTVQLEDGFHLNASLQYLIEKDYEGNFLDETYASDEPSLIPSFFAVFSKDRWAGFFGVDIPVGGGKVDYEDGNFTSYSVGQMMFLTTGLPLVSHHVEAESYGVAYTLGGAFQITDIFSASVGVRYIDATTEFEGGAVNGPLNSAIKFDAEADGWCGIVGMDFFPNDKMTIGIKYATKTELEYDYNVEEGALILGAIDIRDGDQKRDDLPAELALGYSYQISPKLRTEIAFNYYFNKDADIGGITLREGLEDEIDDSWELGLGGEFTISDTLKVSMGYLYSSVGVDPEDSSKFLPDLDAHTLGAGVKWMAMPKLAVNVALGNVFYDSDSYVDTSLGVPIEIEYNKNIPFMAAGIQYSF